MKIAIFHDYFRVVGGAEKLVLYLAQEIGAEIITSECNIKVVEAAGFSKIKIHALGPKTDFPNLLPKLARKRFEQCDFSKRYDFFIFSGNFSIYAAARHSPNIWYCHTPLKGIHFNSNVYGQNTSSSKSANKKTYFFKTAEFKRAVTIYAKIVAFKKLFFKKPWIHKSVGSVLDDFFNNFHNIIIVGKDITRDSLIDIKDNVVDAKNLVKSVSVESSKGYFKSRFSRLTVFFKSFFKLFSLTISLRKYTVDAQADILAVSKINSIVTNSRNIQKKVNLIYGRDSHVIYPPIFQREVEDELLVKRNSYWLSVNRLFPAKRIELQVEAFGHLGERLVIVGGFDSHTLNYMYSLTEQLPDNVMFLGEVNEKVLSNLYEGCTGFITTAEDEDFGMTAVEAMAHGKPVIAPNEGGYKETIVNGENGVLISNISPFKIISAVRTLENQLLRTPNKYAKANVERAKLFSGPIFISKMKEVIFKIK